MIDQVGGEGRCERSREGERIGSNHEDVHGMIDQSDRLPLGQQSGGCVVGKTLDHYCKHVIKGPCGSENGVC